MANISGFSEINKKYDKLTSGISSIKITHMTDQERLEANKAALDKVEEDVNQYEVTDAGESAKPTALDYVNAVLTGAAGLLTAAAPYFSKSNNSYISGYTDPVASGLDGATAAYEKNPCSKNKMALEKALNGAKTDLGTINESIDAITKENPALEKAVNNNDFGEILGQISSGMTANLDAIAKNDKTIKLINTDLKSITEAIVNNNEAKINVKNLDKEAKEILGVKEGEIEVIVKKQEGQNKTLAELKESFNKYNSSVQGNEKEITNHTNKLGEAKNGLVDANESLDKAKKSLDDAKNLPATDENRDKKIKEAEKNVKNAEKDVKDKEKTIKDEEEAIAKEKEQKEKNEAKLQEIGSSIEINGKTLAEIVAARSEAEAARDKAQTQVDDYEVQLKNYTSNAEELTKQIRLNQQKKAENEKSNAVLESQNNNLKNVKINDKARENAKKKLDTNNKILEGLKDRKKSLTASITKAEKALGTSKNSNVPAGNASNSGLGFGITWTSGDEDYDKFRQDYRKKHGSLISEDTIRKAYEESKKA